jgi:hypothetical protein
MSIKTHHLNLTALAFTLLSSQKSFWFLAPQRRLVLLGLNPAIFLNADPDPNRKVTGYEKN